MTFNEDEGAKICAERISAGIDFAAAVINHTNKDFYVCYEEIKHEDLKDNCFFVSFYAEELSSKKFFTVTGAIDKRRTSEESEYIASEAFKIAVKEAKSGKDGDGGGSIYYIKDKPQENEFTRH